MAILADLKKRNDNHEGLHWNVKYQESTGVVLVLFWMSRDQIELAKRYRDILLNDNTYNRNQYGYALNIGVVIDGFGHSRNVYYAVQADETSTSHEFILQEYLSVIGNRGIEVLATDRQRSLIKAAQKVLPTAYHIYCLYHLKTNINDALRSKVGLSNWSNFMSDFFRVYHAPSATAFDSEYADLLQKWPAAADYLDANIYPCREHWAWAWISQLFTAGIRTTSRIEAENKVNKSLVGPKDTFFSAYKKLNTRTDEQKEKEIIALRDVSHTNHDRRRLRYLITDCPKRCLGNA